MKKLIGGVIGLLFVVAVAVFTPSDASAHARFGGDANAVVGCVDDEVADTLIASGAFILNPGAIFCLDFFHSSVVRFLP